MHIAVNALVVYGQFSGVQHAILHQLRSLLNRESPHRYTILALQDVPIDEHIGETVTPYRIVRAPLRSGERAKRILWEQMHLHAGLDEIGADLLYSPGYLTSLRWDGPSVVFIHDTIALSHPHLCTTSNAANFRLLLPRSARHATRVAVPSQSAAEDVHSFCRVQPDLIDVVPLGVQQPPTISAADTARTRESLGCYAPYLLAVSVIEPKKNFANLIRWFGKWKAAGIPHHLVIAGKWGWKFTDVKQALALSRYRQYIHLTGHLPQEQLPALMAGAELLLMPSRYEGFGLPALEAMAAGTPVAVSDRGSLPEVVGEAGLVIPLEGFLWQAEIPTLLQFPDRLQRMREAGKARAAELTWQRTGTRLLEVFDKAIASV